MKKSAYMLAAVMTAGALFSLAACGDNNGGGSKANPVVEGDFKTEATQAEIAEKANPIDLQTAFLGTNPEAFTLGTKLTESLKIAGDLTVTIPNRNDDEGDVQTTAADSETASQSYAIKVNEIAENFSYLVNISSNATDGIGASGVGSAKTTVDAEAPAEAVAYIGYMLQNALGGGTTATRQQPTASAKAAPVKADLEWKMYNVYNKTENKLYGDIAKAELTLGEDTIDFLAKDGFLSGNSKLLLDIKALRDSQGSLFATEQDTTTEGPSVAYNLGTVLAMAQQLGGKVYLDATDGLAVKVSFDAVDLVKGIYNFVTTGSFEAAGDTASVIDTYLEDVTFTSKTVAIYLKFDKNNSFEKVGVELNVAVSAMNLNFGGVAISSNKLSLALDIAAEKTTDTVSPFKDLNTYLDIETLLPDADGGHDTTSDPDNRPAMF